MKFDFEALIIGGGPAGLSAAMTLGRMSRTALLCDDGIPRNAPSEHINNFPTRDGVHPAEWRQLARRDLAKYPTIEIFTGAVVVVNQTAGGFEARLSTGQSKTFEKVILAYGVHDVLPPIPGFKELWGRSIFHCPYCHGFEARGSRLGYLANGAMAFHALPIILDLASDLVLFTNGTAELSSEQRVLLEKNEVEIVEERIEALEFNADGLKSIVLNGGVKREREALFFAPPLPFQLKSQIGEMLGCEKNELGFYKINERGETTVPGVFACGDNVSKAHSVLLAAASGATAGAGVVYALLSERMSRR